MTVWAWTTPLNVDIGAFTLTIGAVTSTETFALIWTAVAVSVIEQPMAWVMVICWAASSSTTLCPDFMVMDTLGGVESSNSRRLPLRLCHSRRLLAESGALGSDSWPFHAAPMMYGRRRLPAS